MTLWLNMMWYLGCFMCMKFKKKNIINFSLLSGNFHWIHDYSLTFNFTGQDFRLCQFIDRKFKVRWNLEIINCCWKMKNLKSPFAVVESLQGFTSIFSRTSCYIIVETVDIFFYFVPILPDQSQMHIIIITIIFSSLNKSLPKRHKPIIFLMTEMFAVNITTQSHLRANFVSSVF